MVSLDLRKKLAFRLGMKNAYEQYKVAFDEDAATAAMTGGLSALYSAPDGRRSAAFGGTVYGGLKSGLAGMLGGGALGVLAASILHRKINPKTLMATGVTRESLGMAGSTLGAGLLGLHGGYKGYQRGIKQTSPQEKMSTYQLGVCDALEQYKQAGKLAYKLGADMTKDEPFYRKPLSPLLMAGVGGLGGYGLGQALGKSHVSSAIMGGGGAALYGLLGDLIRKYPREKEMPREPSPFAGMSEEQLMELALRSIINVDYERGEIIGAQPGEESPFKKR